MAMGNRGEETLCWLCENAIGGCCWSREFEPVPGWTAIEQKLMTNSGKHIDDSFLVMECPQFRRGSVKDWTGRREVNEEGLYLLIGQMLMGMKAEFKEDRSARAAIREFIQGSIYEKDLLDGMTQEAAEADAAFEQKLEDMRIAYINNPDLRESIERKMKSERFKKRSTHDMDKYIRRMKWEAKQYDKAGNDGKAGGDL